MRDNDWRGELKYLMPTRFVDKNSFDSKVLLQTILYNKLQAMIRRITIVCPFSEHSGVHSQSISKLAMR